MVMVLCLELACKYAFTSKLFKSIDEMLLCLFYLYEKLPKKARELKEVVKELQIVFEFPKSGNKPVRCQGSRWINNKRRALQRVVDHYGTYVSHLTALAEDSSVKAEERARLKGYLKTWTNYNTIVRCTMYIDILQSPSLLSISLQASKLNVVLGIKNILKSTTALKNLGKKDPFEWPRVKLLLQKIENEESKKFYQGAELQKFDDAAQVRMKQDALQGLMRR